MTKLIDTNLELSYLKAICDSYDSNSKLSLTLLSKINQTFFFSKIAQEVYFKIKDNFARTSRITNFDSIASDISIEDAHRDILKDLKNNAVEVNKNNYKDVFTNLDSLRKARYLKTVAENIATSLDSNKVDIDKLFEQSVSTLSGIKSAKEDAECFTVIGKGANFNEKLAKLLSGNVLRFMPSGFNGWDSKNNGLPIGKLGIIAATSGGGKSLMGIQLALNVANYGNKVCIVPLEMNDMDMLHRITANKTELSMSDIAKGKSIDASLRQKAYDSLIDYSKKLADKDGAVHLFNPAEDIDMETLLIKLQPYSFDMIIVDYIGLLKGFDGDNQWRKMSEAIRYAKIWAEKTGTTALIMAQLNDDMMLKFSRSMKDHADLMWTWNPGKISQLENGEAVIRIEPQKGRNQEQAVFYLHSSFKKMQMFDATEQEIKDYELKMKVQAAQNQTFNNGRGQKFMIDAGKSNIKAQ